MTCRRRLWMKSRRCFVPCYAFFSGPVRCKNVDTKRAKELTHIECHEERSEQDKVCPRSTKTILCDSHWCDNRENMQLMKLTFRKKAQVKPMPNGVLLWGSCFLSTCRKASSVFLFAIPFQAMFQFQGHGVGKGAVFLTFFGLVLVGVFSYWEGQCASVKEQRDNETERRLAMDDAKAFEEWKRKRFKD